MSEATTPAPRAGFSLGPFRGPRAGDGRGTGRGPPEKAWFSDPVAANWEFCQRAVLREAPKAEILCLGSSLLKFGALPVVIEKATGRRAYNLALSNGRLPATYFHSC